MTYEQYFRREEMCGVCATPTTKALRLSLHSVIAIRRVHLGDSRLSDESAFLVPRMSAWRRSAIKRPLTRMPDEEIIYRFQLSRTLPAGTDTQSMIALNRTLYERARDMGGFRMTSSAVPMTQADWMRHYGPVWPMRPGSEKEVRPEERADAGTRDVSRLSFMSPAECCVSSLSQQVALTLPLLR